MTCGDKVNFLCCITRGNESTATPFREYNNFKEYTMLGWSIAFFILAIIAGLFGFTGLAVAMAGVAQILFVVFLVLLVLSFIVRALKGRSVV